MSVGTDSQTSSQYLSGSRTLLQPSKRASSEISKTYKHASQLFLTRRLSEAYDALRPLIQRPKVINGHTQIDEEATVQAPIASATTSQRIKIWSLYVTLLNSIVELGAEDGKKELAPKDYKDVLNLVQNGDVWEQIVRDGYQGVEGAVDAEVVYNLSTLLLGQALDQATNQSRLETYLSSSSLPSFELPTSLGDSIASVQTSHSNGTSTPKDLSSRIKILELFTLHVLPRNNEWDYARSFIQNSDILDEERREAFLQTLEELQELRHDDEEYGEEAIEDDEEDEAAADTSSATNQSRAHKRTSSEVDYGIEKSPPNGKATASAEKTNVSAKPPLTTTSPPSQPPMTNVPPQPEPETISTTPPRPTSSRKSSGRVPLSPPAQTPRRSLRKAKPGSRTEQNSIIVQARHFITGISNLARNLAGSLSSNPTAIFRMFLFLLAFLLAFSRKQVRDRAKQILESSWKKIRGTVGMGTKVSYI